MIRAPHAPTAHPVTLAQLHAIATEHGRDEHPAGDRLYVVVPVPGEQRAEVFCARREMTS